MAHKYEVTRPALRVLLSLTKGQSPDEDDVQQLRACFPDLDVNVPIHDLAIRVVEQQMERRQKVRGRKLADAKRMSARASEGAPD
jgi:hypothetical protein